MISQEMVRELFDYRDGALYWKNCAATNVKPGDRAGCQDVSGYRDVRVLGKKYREHRIIFLYHHGYIPKEVDHVKGKCNKIENLRACTSRQNIANRPLFKKSQTGLIGVSWYKSKEMFVAQGTLNNKRKHIGYFICKIQAALAYDNFVAANYPIGFRTYNFRPQD